MSLRELKEEIRNLTPIDEQVERFRKSWVKPLKNNTNKHLPFLQELSFEEKKELNENLLPAHKIINSLALHSINDKLNLYSRYLIELKLTTINGDKNKSKLITDRLLKDSFLKLQNTIEDVAAFESGLRDLNKHYDKINDLLNERLNLEDSVSLSEFPHKQHLNSLKETNRQHKQILKKLGEEFVALTRKTRQIN